MGFHFHLADLVRVLAIAAIVLGSTTSLHAQGKGKGGGPSYQIIKLDTNDGAGRTLEGTAIDINDSRLVAGIVDGPAACWFITETDGKFKSALHFLDESYFSVSGAFGCNGGNEQTQKARTVPGLWSIGSVMDRNLSTNG